MLANRKMSLVYFSDSYPLTRKKHYGFYSIGVNVTGQSETLSLTLFAINLAHVCYCCPIFPGSVPCFIDS